MRITHESLPWSYTYKEVFPLVLADLTVGWLNQVGQAEIEAAVRLQTLAQAEINGGNVQDGYLHYIGAQLATQMQRTSPDTRLPCTTTVSLGQYNATVTINGDCNDDRGFAGFSYTLTDTDPDRTRLIALAQQAVGRAAADAVNRARFVGGWFH